MTRHCSFFPTALAALMLPAMASAQTTPNTADAKPAAASAPAPARDIGGIWEPLTIRDGILDERTWLDNAGRTGKK